MRLDEFPEESPEAAVVADALVAALFAIAAKFYHSAAQATISGSDPLRVALSRGGEWHVSVLARPGTIGGMVLYAKESDQHQEIRARQLELSPLARISGPSSFEPTDVVLALMFADRRDVPASMRRGAKRMNLPLASPSAYPIATQLNPAHGPLSLERLSDIITTAGLVTQFLADHPDPYGERSRRQKAIAWADASATGTVTYTGRYSVLDDLLPWNLLEPIDLLTSGPEGPGATPGAMLAHDANPQLPAAERRTLIEEFGPWLRTPPQDESRRPVSPATARKEARIADLLVDYMHSEVHAPLGAITELDLRIFLYDHLPLARRDLNPEPRIVLGGLKEFFRFLERKKGITTPWHGLLDDQDEFERRWAKCPGPDGDEDALYQWREQLTHDLHHRALIPGCPELINDDGVREFTAEEEAAVCAWTHSPGYHGNLGRRWLVWRDEEIRAGVRDGEELLVRLEARRGLAA